MARTDPRPWRATAHRPNPYGGRRRQLVGRAAARTEDGLARFVDQHSAAGDAVATWRVQALEEELTDGT